MPIAIALHMLAVVVWVGGMFFAYMVLRPVAATLLEPPQRLALWSQIFARFFPWVWLAVGLLPASGYWMIFGAFGGLAKIGAYIHLMSMIGWTMVAIFGHVYFAPYRRLTAAVAAQNWPEGGKQLGRIRRLVGINLILGLITIVVATVGAYVAA